MNLDNGVVMRFHVTNVHTTFMGPTARLADGVGEAMDTRCESAFDIENQVIGYGADNAVRLESKMYGLHAKVKLPFDTKGSEFDSADEQQGPIAKAIAALAGESVQLVLDRDARLVSLRGVASLLKPWRPDAKELGVEESASLVETMRQMFLRESLESTFGNLFVTLPREPVGVGDFWTIEADMMAALALPVTMQRICKVTAIDADEVHVTVDGSPKPNQFETAAMETSREEWDKQCLGWSEVSSITTEVGLIGSARLSRRDGLAIHQMFEIKAIVSARGPAGDSLLTTTHWMRSTLDRISESTR